MSLMSYKESLESSKEVKEKKLIASQVKQASCKAELWIAEQEEEVASKEVALEKATQSTEHDMDKIMDLVDELDLAKRRLEEGKKVISELFPK